MPQSCAIIIMLLSVKNRHKKSILHLERDKAVSPVRSRVRRSLEILAFDNDSILTIFYFSSAQIEMDNFGGEIAMSRVAAISIDSIAGNANDESRTQNIKNHFIIPNYQRGYRWISDDVKYLLDDINNARKSEKEKYCLQPIVVIPVPQRDEEVTGFFGTDNNARYWKKCWEVVDGQQRLTTVFLTLWYLAGKLDPSDVFSLEYATRDETNQKVRNWVNAIMRLPRFDTNPFPKIELNDNDGLDIHYMHAALKCIESWFTENCTQQTLKEFRDYLRFNTYMIWYEIDDQNPDPIKLFSQLNMGKIPLTAAEQLKAMLLKKEAQEGNNAEQKIQNQSKRAIEWDRIEHLLSDDSFFRFICVEKDKTDETRMDYLFQLVYLCETNNDTILDNEGLFRYFERKINDAGPGNITETLKEIWERITGIVRLCEEWYKNREAYHKIGFLIACSKDKCAIVLKKCIEEYQKSTAKSEFYKGKLDKMIKDLLKDNLGDNAIEELNYDDNKASIKSVLLLFNVLTAIQSTDYRFSFDKVYPLDTEATLEHIFPQTPKVQEIVKGYKNAGTAVSDRKEATRRFVKTVHDDMDGKMSEDEISKWTVEIESALLHDDENEIDIDKELKDWWKRIMEIYELDDDTVQSIGNLALISHDINSKLSNKMFYEKQLKIKELDKEGKFIPLCTHNAFLKYYNIDGADRQQSSIIWGKGDIRNHLDGINKMLEDYLPNQTIAITGGADREL